MSPKRLEGWEPAETHTYRYSRDGTRVTSVAVTRETEWDDEQRGWALALNLYEAQIGPCGHYLPRTTAPDAEDGYVVPLPDRCHACTAIREKLGQYNDSPHPEALLFHAEPRRLAGVDAQGDR